MARTHPVKTRKPEFIFRYICSVHYAVHRQLLWWGAVLTTLVSLIAARHATPYAEHLFRTALHSSLSVLVFVSLGGLLIWWWREQQDEILRYLVCDKKVMRKAPARFSLRCKLTADETEELLRGPRGKYLRPLVEKMQPGDELWQYCSNRRSWMALAGRSGFMICREGRVIGGRLTRIS
jgi:hypothetical protein